MGPIQVLTSYKALNDSILINDFGSFIQSLKLDESQFLGEATCTLSEVWYHPGLQFPH